MCIIILQCVQCFPIGCSYGDYNSTIKVFNWPSSHVYFLIPVTITLDNYQTSNAKHNYSMIWEYVLMTYPWQVYLLCKADVLNLVMRTEMSVYVFLVLLVI